MGKTNGEHTEQESNSKGAGERPGEERDERRGTRGRGVHLAWLGTVKGQAPRGQRDRTRAQRGNETRKHVQCCRACVQGRGYREAGSIAGKEKKRTPTSTAGERTAQSEKAVGERNGASKADEGTRVAKNKKKQQCRGAGPGGRAPNKSRKKHTTHTKGGNRPVLGARNGSGMDKDPVGPRRRVAAGPVG